MGILKKKEGVHFLGGTLSIPNGWRWLSDFEFYNMHCFFYSGKTLGDTGSAQSKLFTLISPDLLALKVFSFIWVTLSTRAASSQPCSKLCSSVTVYVAQCKHNIFYQTLPCRVGGIFMTSCVFFIQQKCDAAQVICDCFGPKKADAVD